MKIFQLGIPGEVGQCQLVNWYGAHMEGHVVNGLDKRSIAGIATTIASLGFNCVRQTNPLEVRGSEAPSCVFMAQIPELEWTSLMSDCPSLWSSSITILSWRPADSPPTRSSRARPRWRSWRLWCREEWRPLIGPDPLIYCAPVG